MSHTATITAEWHDCGALRYHVACTCGYEGMDADGLGCWQTDHNRVYTLDATHAALLDTAFHQTTPGTLQDWRPGPDQPQYTVTIDA